MNGTNVDAPMDSLSTYQLELVVLDDDLVKVCYEHLVLE